jgi:hypothetical protein
MRLIELENPVLKGRKFQIRPERRAAIVQLTEEGYIRVGWFDFGNGRREGFVEHSPQDFQHFWKPYAAKTPVAPREPRPMVVSRHPDISAISTLPHIGYWAADKDPMRDHYESRHIMLPWPEDFLDPEWKGHEKTMVFSHLRSAPDIRCFDGFAKCRLCNTMVGSTDKSDGSYVWPSGLAHYVEAHSLRPTPDFVHHIIRYNASVKRTGESHASRSR